MAATAPPDLTAPYRELLAAIRDALTVPLPADETGQRAADQLQRGRAQAVHAITDAVLNDETACIGCVETATQVLQDRTLRLPVTYRRYITEAEPLPDDCAVHGSEPCCAPVLGVRGARRHRLAGATVVSTR